MSSLRIDVSRGGLPPFPLANIRGYGHSIAFGGNATRVGVTNFYSRIATLLDPTRFTLSYVGHPSQYTLQMLPQAAADVDAFYVPGKINIFMYMEVINSVSYYMATLGQSAATAATNALADHMAMFAGRKAAGYQVCIAYTMYQPFGFSAQNMACVDLINAGLRAAVGGGVIDAVIDIAATADPRFTITGPPGTSLVVADNTHPNDFGHQCIADDSMASIYAQYTLRGGPSHLFTPNDLTQLLFWYEADTTSATFDTSNNVSLLKDKGSWLFDMSASGAARPKWNANNALYGGKPTIDAFNSCMTTALNVDLTYTKTFQIILLYQCTNTGTIMFEHSSSYSTHSDAFLFQYHNVSTGPEITTSGNVGNSIVRTTGPTNVRSVSFIVDNTVSTNQCVILDELAVASGTFPIDAPNTNLGGLYPMNIFARNGVIAPSTMSLAAALCFSRKLSTPELTLILNYLQAKWPH